VKLYHTPSGIAVLAEQRWFRAHDFGFDELFRASDPVAWLRPRLEKAGEARISGNLHPPLAAQEVWAAGVTYYRSREARMAESVREADVYDRVYQAERPELFFKATPHRVVGHGADVRIRADSPWNVPEAELTLAVNREGRIFGYTIGNDMSSRSIEGANPLYLPQAKIYDGGCALGPALVPVGAVAPPFTVGLEVRRSGRALFVGETSTGLMRRPLAELVEYLGRELRFPYGCVLLTGTGIVPPDDVTLQSGDLVRIQIDGLGTLANPVE
jgi:2-dehydro-3-deoxy-D-arabinonate dehydratase